MKVYLVTGGAGFIGSNFIHYLFSNYGNEHKVINLDLLTYAGNLKNVDEFTDNNQYVFVKGDIGDAKLLDELFDEYPIDYVVNFAAQSHVDRSIENPGIFVDTNIKGTQVLIDVAMKHWSIRGQAFFLPGKKFIQVSTDEVYGSLGPTGYFTEETNTAPHNPYSASKASADLLVKAYYDTYGFPMNITRCSNNFGPYQFPEKLIPLVILRTLKGKAIPIYGDGQNIRDWLYVQDHCKAIDLVINKGQIGQIYNIGGNNEMKNIQIVERIIKIVYRLLNDNDPRKEHISDRLLQFVEDRKGHDRRYAIDASKIKNELGWEPEVDFEQGLEKTVKWYLDNREWIEHIESGAYLKEHQISKKRGYA